ncbi:alpha/beta hydrolase [Amycolatopsis magusensis]|uniref:Pimeloyl-ACP methyl ester carboxylesterase n=1 Tax=Amycolatopsis magusensis TaxID=882444 RepID=A0ABS4Q048_9PSEU|nr:alpha/beta hydrolase [Amycolatopsis magusensis]MBP2184494.1 pimeloyl-ACP methyl ester carboxylesterase [Amycolatopsis magusensis]
MNQTTTVFVHGAWHSSLHWAATQRALAAHGVPSVAVDLPGHGLTAPVPSGYLRPGQPGLATEPSGVAQLTAEQLVDALVADLAEVRRRSARVVLVAHSAGGGPASAAAERHPDLVDHLVYLSAFVPGGRPRFVEYVAAEENADAVQVPRNGDPEAIGAFRINPLSPDPEEVATIRRAFLNDWPADRPGWRLSLHPDEPLASLTGEYRLTARRWGRVPRSYIRLTGDLALPPATQDLMIAEADRAAPDSPCTVFSLPGGHSPFLTRPKQLAGVLAGIAKV